MNKISRIDGKAFRKQTVNYSAHRRSMWCRNCGANVETVSLKEAAEIVRADKEEIISRAVEGKIHLGICREAVLFCVDSLIGNEDLFPKTVIGENYCAEGN